MVRCATLNHYFLQNKHNSDILYSADSKLFCVCFFPRGRVSYDLLSNFKRNSAYFSLPHGIVPQYTHLFYSLMYLLVK